MMGITRREFVELLGLTASSHMATAAQTRTAQRPNIVLLLGDDHRADALGCAGNRFVKTPHLDAMAGEGLHFVNHFCTTPICCVSRASIMTGQYAATHGIYDFATPLSPAQVQRSYFGQMRRNGYYTGFLGKFGVGATMPADAFDVWKGFGGQGKYFPNGEPGPHLTDILSEQTTNFIRSAPRDRPFCLSVSYKAPHEQDEDPRTYLPSATTLARYAGMNPPLPQGAPESDIERFPLPIQRSENRRRWSTRYTTTKLRQETMKGYYALITGIDDAVGALRKELSAQGLADNTVILYSADHGVYHGEHGFAGKWYAHEEPTRIPLIVFDPRSAASRKGVRVSDPTLNLDLHPTLLDLAGIPLPGGTHGRSLLSTMRGSAPGPQRAWYVEHKFPDAGLIPSSRAVRSLHWKYIQYTDNAAPFEEIYDLRNDPHEVKNLAVDASHQGMLAKLRAQCDTWSKSFAAGDAWREPLGAADLEA
ncbi:sulfatase family protein [Terriglobus roseus]|nr:sulfatase [Terriglobus roseus]